MPQHQPIDEEMEMMEATVKRMENAEGLYYVTVGDVVVTECIHADDADDVLREIESGDYCRITVVVDERPSEECKPPEGVIQTIPKELGTHVRLPDGRVGTVVFNGLVGVGIKWGLHDPPAEDFASTDGNSCHATMTSAMPEDWPWEPDALLRAPWPGAEKFRLECVGEDVEILRAGYGI